MIKISHVMTIYTNNIILCIVYNFVLYVYNIIWNIMKYFRYVLQAKYKENIIELASNSFIYEINEFDVM